MATETPGRTLRLTDGRFLGYAEYGDPAGKPVLFFHGFPGSRLEAQLAHAAARRLGARVIALDRPGFGLSDFKRGRTYLDWPDDVAQAADLLAIERFAVMGLSGGGPYAAACALKIPQRLSAVGIVSGVAPVSTPGAASGMSLQNRLGFIAGRFYPLARAAMWWMGRQARLSPERLISSVRRSFAEVDGPILTRPEMRDIFVADVREAFRQGSRGAAWELAMHSRPWGFRLQDIQMEVHLWQGEADANVPVAMGRHQAGAIPNCRATFYPGEGHFMAIDRMEEIAGALLHAP